MLNTNNLSYWTLQKFPYILTPISNFMFFTLSKGQSTTISTNNHTFCYVKSGTVKSTFENYEAVDKNEQINLTTGMFVQWSGQGFLEFAAVEENTRILVISFKLLRPNQPDDNESADVVNYTIPVLMQRLTIEMPHTLTPEVASVERRLLENMCTEADKRSVGYFNKLQLLLSQLVIEIVRNHPKMPRYIDAVAITSNTDNDRPLAKGREIYIKDVEIWCNNPAEEGSFILRTMRSDRYFVSNNGDTNEKINYELVCDDNGKKIGKMYTNNKALCYKVLFWADSGIKPFDIELYTKKWIYVRTKIKSNMTGNVGLAVYTTKGHHWFGSPVMIECPDTWQDVSVPVMFVQGSNDASPIVANAMKYIHQNYTQKISLKSVAEAIYTNPNYLSTVFSREKGMTFSAYVKNYRLTVAQKMLIETDQSIEKIALSVGFYDIQHFSKIFKKEFGVSPIGFRNANKIK